MTEEARREEWIRIYMADFKKAGLHESIKFIEMESRNKSPYIEDHKAAFNRLWPGVQK